MTAHPDRPVDPDVDLHQPEQRQEWRKRWVLPVIALGGAVGAAARHALELAVPSAPGEVPWPTLLVNVVGCLLIGLLMAHVEAGRGHPLLRPFLGAGVLGGFTTFSTYAVDVLGLAATGRGAAAVGYLLGTVLAALVAVLAGLAAGRRLVPAEVGVGA